MKTRYAEFNTLKATFHRRAGDEALDLAQAVKPRMFATSEEREPYALALEHVSAERRREAVHASIAADEILHAAGFSWGGRRTRGQR